MHLYIIFDDYFSCQAFRQMRTNVEGKHTMQGLDQIHSYVYIVQDNCILCIHIYRYMSVYKII